jgi:EipB-like
LLDDYSSISESADGNQLAFRSKTTGKDEIVHTVSGLAKRDTDGISVRYNAPQRLETRLPAATLFPVAYTKALIVAAKGRQTTFDHLQFDGSDETGKAEASIAVIGRPKSGTDSDEVRLVEKSFGKQELWPVSIGFGFEGQEISEYSINQDLFENGVAINLTLDLNDFKMRGHLQDVTKLEEKPCN